MELVHMDTGQRRERKDVRRNMERVLAAAHALVAERGAVVTMEEIAQRAGVGVGTLYRRFPSKEHLFTAINQTVCADTQQCLIAVTDTQLDPVGKLEALARAHCLHSMKHAALRELRPHTEARQQDQCGFEGGHTELYATLHQLFKHLITQGQQQGMIRRGDPHVLAALCVELLHPRAIYHLQHVLHGNRDAVVDQVVQFMLYSLGARSVHNGDEQGAVSND
jgi:AcrR family transcriptional regulator